MGYVKYSEDNEEITNERRYEREIEISFAPKRIYYDCYYCNKSFESSDNRNNHIRSSHNDTGPLLFINEKITSDETYVDSIKSAKIVLCGFNDVMICVDDKKISNDTPDIDLIPYFKKENDKHIIKIGQKTVRILKYDCINISSNEVDKIIKRWEEQTENSQRLEPSTGSYPSTLNEAEIHYLNGFFEYFTACKATDPTYKKDRYETAFGILSSFNKLTSKARVLLKVIAFRFNWIELLEHFSKETQATGVFHIIADFYLGKKYPISEKEGKGKIFIENNLEEHLNAILAYQKNEMQIVDDFLAEWPDAKIDGIEDSNIKDRIYFLKARRNDKKYFEKIRTPYLKRISKLGLE